MWLLHCVTRKVIALVKNHQKICISDVHRYYGAWRWLYGPGVLYMQITGVLKKITTISLLFASCEHSITHEHYGYQIFCEVKTIYFYQRHSTTCVYLKGPVTSLVL